MYKLSILAGSVVFTFFLTAAARAADLFVPSGQTYTVTGAETVDVLRVQGTLIVEGTGSLTFNARSEVDGPAPGGHIIVNGGTVTGNARFDTDGTATITVNGGLFRVNDTFKFPDNAPGPVYMIMNGGTLSAGDIQTFLDRNPHWTIGGGVIRLDGDIAGTGNASYDPLEWIKAGAMIPAEGYAQVMVEYVADGDFTEIYAIPGTKASRPDPENGKPNISKYTEITWKPALGVTAQRVYFGTDPENPALLLTLDHMASSVSNSVLNGGAPLEAETTYYWRVDSEADPNAPGGDPNSVYTFEGEGRGDLWSFTTVGRYPPASGPEPANGATNVSRSQVLSWQPAEDADYYCVYLGTDEGAVTSGTRTVGDIHGAGRVDFYDFALLAGYWLREEVSMPWVNVDGVGDADLKDLRLLSANWLGQSAAAFKGSQADTSFDPFLLEPATNYYWRVDAVDGDHMRKGDTWAFKTNVLSHIEYATVFAQPGKFAGWPANNGVWTWGDNEILVSFTIGRYVEQGGHNISGQEATVLGRSLDGGQTWTMEDPDNFVGDGGAPLPPPGGINFAHPGFALRVVSYTSQGRFFFSYDRGHTWQGPYTCGTLMNHPELAGLENSSRTDYMVNGPDDCFIFMSARGSGTDRAFVARTTDGGATFNFVSWINPEPVGTTRGVMPSTVRISATKLVTALRRKYPGEWIDAFVSYDNGSSWSFLSKVADTACCNGNPPALIRLSDGRLCCAYGNRAVRRIHARFSSDEGETWGEEIILRDDYQPDIYNDADLGYCRMVQRPDGKLVTMYYWQTPEQYLQHISSIESTIWQAGKP